ncbi:MAG TPA: response regulator [Phycisphaerae bacterium]|jgi:DNA-binding NtrC family response regulator
MPANRPDQIMLVETDPALAEVLAESIAPRLDAQITRAASAEAALDTDLFEPHDAFIGRLDLPGLDGLELAARILAVRRRPFFLIGDALSAPQAIHALRLGVNGFFTKPFDLADLLDSLDLTLYAYNEARRQQRRQRQLRQLVRRVVRQRRDLNSRMDLICRDLVQAHRRLVSRVLAQESRPRESV